MAVPTVLSANIGYDPESIDGSLLTIVFSEAVEDLTTISDGYGFTVLIDSVPANVNYVSGNGTATGVFSVTSAITSTSVITLAYDDIAGIYSVSTTDYLVGFSGVSVTNIEDDTRTLSHNKTDENDTTVAVAVVAVPLLSLIVSDDNDVTVATSSVLNAITSITTDGNDISIATISVSLIVESTITDDGDLTAATIEQFGWFAQSTTIDQNDVTVATVATLLSVELITVDADDITVATVDNIAPALSSITTDSNDITAATASVSIQAQLATTDSHDVTIAIAAIGTRRNRGFYPQNFVPRSFLGV